MCSIHRHIGLLVLSDSIGVRHRIATEIARISPPLLLRRGAGIEHNNLFYGWPLIEVMCVYIEGSGGGRGDDGGWNRMTAVAVVGLGSPCYMLSHFFFFFILNIYIYVYFTFFCMDVRGGRLFVLWAPITWLRVQGRTSWGALPVGSTLPWSRQTYTYSLSLSLHILNNFPSIFPHSLIFCFVFVFVVEIRFSRSLCNLLSLNSSRVEFVRVVPFSI